jgi:hypothetical protein
MSRAALTVLSVLTAPPASRSVTLIDDGCPTAPAATTLLTAVGLAPGVKAEAVIHAS